MQVAEEGRRQEIVRRRLVGMGLDARPEPGGRALVVTLSLRPDPFETLAGKLWRFASVTFATVGDDRMKCLKPTAFFHLPFVRIVDCASPAEIEARIRTAWQVRVEALRRARRWLEKLGAEVESSEGGPVLEFPIGVEDPLSRGRVIESGRVLLPGRGPLSGVALRRAEDRTFPASLSWTSALDLELAITTRLEELARLDARLQREERLVPKHETALPPAASRQRPARILVVGSRFASVRSLH